MRLPDIEAVLSHLSLPDLPLAWSCRREGRLTEVGAACLQAPLPGAKLGELCRFGERHLAEVIALRGEQALLSPFCEPLGVGLGDWVLATGQTLQVPVGEALLGRVLDALGEPLDGQPLHPQAWRAAEADPPSPLQRAVISRPLPVGVRAIDAALTVGEGQRMGIFAPPGCGKSTLLGMLSTGAEVDVVVLALIGERGREVREFLQHVLSPAVRARSVLVVATSDRPALERIKAAATATTMAEAFREAGMKVLLLVDSLTRYARAVREVALAAGEPLVAGGYPPSLYARLPRLLERPGCLAQGSISAFYTVLMEDRADPLAEEVRSLLDGHIVLSRKLAEANHYPAIDLLASISRVMPLVTSPAQREQAARVRQWLATWQEIELLLRIGEYQPGQDALADEAVARREAIRDLLCQPVTLHCGFDETLAMLDEVASGAC
ncbi:FliI/YscN family ATPase [Paludibacterium sp. B53371]|uniref:FliI/YscN family ATPase n=1 Tax=Paludibacterium sp. B53371 TaxID=2806263 RepID=UPI00207B9801|nr:FliI/YscN family ATPase [Paludibacterium sp. B53371]